MTRAGFGFAWWLGITILAVWAALIAFACGWAVIDWWRLRRRSERELEARERDRQQEQALEEQAELLAELDRVVAKPVG